MSTINITDIPPIDLNFMAVYDKNFGFRYNLHQITGIEDKGKLFQVIASVNPPSSPYLQADKSMYAAFPFIKFDWSSTEETINFVDDDLVIVGLELTKTSCIIYDIKAYDMKTKITSNYGFAVYPLTALF